MLLDATFVKESLRRLSATKTDVFGAGGHGFSLNPPLLEIKVSEIEHRHNIQLPQEYRHFLTAIGNGGAGPFYGLFPWGKWDGAGRELETWAEAGDFVGILSEPFPLMCAWNDLEGRPPSELMDTNEEEYERLLGEFERIYWDTARLNGAVPICTEGCALRIWLVLTGEQAGRLWRDDRADDKGLAPLSLADESPATFSRWYADWLEGALQQARML